MHTVTAPRQHRNHKPLVGAVPAVGTGHATQRPARFQDKRLKRQKTRQTQVRSATTGW